MTDEKDMALLEKRLRQSIEAEHIDLAALLAKAKKKRDIHLAQEIDFPTRIAIENDAHPVYTLVDIQSPDRLGLLASLLHAFSETGVQIALSRIATEKGAAIDSFYITDAQGHKLRDATTIARLQKALQAVSQTPPAA